MEGLFFFREAFEILILNYIELKYPILENGYEFRVDEGFNAVLDRNRDISSFIFILHLCLYHSRYIE